MADISYKNKKFPLKAVPTISLAFIVAAISSISVMYFLDDDENFLDLNEFEVQEIEYEFQTILEEDSFNNLDIIEVVLCLLYTSPSPRDKRQSRMPSSA